MPRARKTMSGAPAQPLAQVPDQVFGQGVDLMQMQRAMPSPQVAGQTPPGMPPGAAVGHAPPPAVAAAQPGAAPSGDPHAALLAQAAGLRDHTGLLTAPTLRPNEPITAGLNRGPGPGPEALAASTGSPAGDMMRRLSASTGDPLFAALADRARA